MYFKSWALPSKFIVYDWVCRLHTHSMLELHIFIALCASKGLTLFLAHSLRCVKIGRCAFLPSVTDQWA